LKQILFLWLVLSGWSWAQPTHELVFTAQHVGPFDRHTRRSQLVQWGLPGLDGQGQLDGRKVALTEVWLGDPRRRLSLYWVNSRLARVLILTKAWNTPEGLGVGVPMSHLRSLNRKPIRLVGGRIRDWGGGRLAPRFQGIEVYIQGQAVSGFGVRF
jgi:hypothetical protein